MAERRMFAKTIIDSDAFLDMSLTTQALYFHLSMRADDDGFINNPKKIQRMIGAADDDLKVLIAKNFIIPFESGIVVIKHWRLHNYIQKDRYKETVYLEEKATLEVKDNKSYTLADTSCIHDVYNMDTQVRLGKDSIELGKDSIEEISIDENVIDMTKAKKEKSARHKHGTFQRILLTDAEYEKLCKEFGEEFIKNQIELLDEYVESNNNKNGYKNFNLVIRKSIRDGWFKQAKAQTQQGATNNPFFNVLIEEGKM